MAKTTFVDYDNLSLKDLEKKLKIKKFNSGSRTPSTLRNQTFDTWSDVAEFINDKVVSINTSQYKSCDVYGYELINDNQYIKVYYSISSLNG